MELKVIEAAIVRAGIDEVATLEQPPMPKRKRSRTNIANLGSFSTALSELKNNQIPTQSNIGRKTETRGPGAFGGS
jgi:hypothetical protein